MVTTLGLSSIYGERPIFRGSFSAQVSVILIAAFFGRFFVDNMRQSRVKFFSGLLFLSIGILQLSSKLLID